MNRRFVLAAGLLLLSGCATPAPVLGPAGAPLEELEALYGASAGREALTIRVSSNGCTRKDDFAVYVDREGGGARLAFGRKRLDTCQSFAPGQVELSFTYEELGVGPRTPMFLLNPLERWPGP